MGPYFRVNIKELMKKNCIGNHTLVWHPLLDDWKIAMCTKALNTDPIKDMPEISSIIENLKKANEKQPIILKQGYLCILGTKEGLWKSRWVMMTKDSLNICKLPGNEPKKILKYDDIKINAKVSEEKEIGLIFEILINDKGKMTFWSKFQREV